MSDPLVSTGITRTARCRCGTLVTQHECRSAFHGEIHWDTSAHSSPCGLPCLQGGISPATYRSAEWHKDADRCPRCNPGSDPRVLTDEERADGERLSREAEQQMIEAMLDWSYDDDEGDCDYPDDEDVATVTA